MKKIIAFFGTAILLLVFAASSMAQVTASAGAEATIVTPLTITWASDMNFGNIAVINQIGTVTLDTNAVRTATGGATPVTNPTGTVSTATFNLTGNAGYQVFVTLPASPPGIDVIHTNLSDFMNVTDFRSGNNNYFIMPIGGTKILRVGATLHTGISQLPGVYHTASNFAVTVNYQ